MPAPVNYPIWAQLNVTLPVAGTQNKVRPVEGLRDTGFDLGQQPAAEEFNWMWNNIFEWIQYFDTETIIARGIGVEVDDITEVVDVRDNIQVWQETLGTLTIVENPTSTNIELAYSLNDIAEVKTTKVIRAGTKEFCVEFEGVVTPPVDSYSFFVEVDGVRAGVLVDSGGAKRLSNPATVIDGAYSFDPASKVGLRLRSSGDVEIYLDGVQDIILDSVVRSAESLVKFGFEIDGTSANTAEINVAHNFNHTFTFATTGFTDASDNPFDTGVAGIDTLDSRRLSEATEARVGVVKKATVEEAQAFSEEGVLTGETLAAAFGGPNQSGVENGYQILPGGIMIQWGFFSTTGSGNNRTATFHKPFSGVPYNIQWTVHSGSGSTIGSGGHSYAKTATDFSFRISDTYRAVGDGIYWYAVGPA